MKFLYLPVDIASLVFFRVAFGILGLIDVLSTWIYYHFEKQAFEPENFQFTYYGFEWTEPLPEPFLSIFFILLSLAAILITIGYQYRIATVFFAFGFTYTFLLEKAHYLNHGYLFCWISFIMIYLPAHRNFSIAVLKRPELRINTIPAWCLLILPFLMGMVYFFGGVAKINEDWLNAMPLKLWLKSKSDLFLIGPILAKEATAYFMAYGGLALDLFVVFFLLFRKTRIWALFFVLFFHFVNLLIFNIGIFPFLSTTLTLLFFPPDFPRKIFRWCKKRIPKLGLLENWWEQSLEDTAVEPGALWQKAPRWRLWINTALLGLILIHLTLPLRHHFFPGDVAWTEEGHRYSWRMMLRSKQGHGHFIVENKKTGERDKVISRNYLSHKQNRKLYTHPDMILQFAHYLRDVYQKEGKEVAVYAEIKVRLNGRPYHVYVDPEVDLSQEKWCFFKKTDWILPEEAD